MKKPDWAKVIQFMYRDAPEPINASIDSDHPLITEAGLRKEVARDALDSLAEWGLIKQQSKSVDIAGKGKGKTETKFSYKLTKDGFDVAHERELSQRNNRINYSLVFLTFVLAMAQIIGIAPLSDGFKIVGSFILLGVVFYVVLWTDLLER